MIYLNLGRREVGKTTLAAYIVSKLNTQIIFDPRGLFPAGHRVIDQAGLDRAFSKGGFDGPIVITPDTDIQGLYDAMCREVKYLLRMGRQSIGIVIDELRFIPDPDGPDMNWVLRCATRDSVCVVFTAHRPVDVPVDIRAISDVWCVFHMTQENDLKVITERCSPVVAQQVPKLLPRQFIAWNDALGTMTAHTRPERWHVPLRATSAVIETYRPVDALDGDDIAARSDRFDFTK